MPNSYNYKNGSKPYLDMTKLTPRVRQIIELLKEERGWGRLARIAYIMDVSRVFVWEVEHRCIATERALKTGGKI